jgi:hypothetical protein
MERPERVCLRESVRIDNAQGDGQSYIVSQSVIRFVAESERSNSNGVVGMRTEGNVKSKRGDGRDGVIGDRTAEIGKGEDKTQCAQKPH